MRRTGLPVDSLPDETLLAGLGGGDPEASLAFVRRFQRLVFGVALAVVGDRTLAEDVSQQAFERAWRSASLYDPLRGSVRAWLSTIAHRLAIDAVRARRQTPVDPADLAALIRSVVEGPERQAVQSDDTARLRQALAQLPAAQTRALVMASIYGLSGPEIAEADGIPLGTVKTRIRMAMGKLRVALADQGADHG